MSATSTMKHVYKSLLLSWSFTIKFPPFFPTQIAELTARAALWFCRLTQLSVLLHVSLSERRKRIWLWSMIVVLCVCTHRCNSVGFHSSDGLPRRPLNRSWWQPAYWLYESRYCMWTVQCFGMCTRRQSPRRLTMSWPKMDKLHLKKIRKGEDWKSTTLPFQVATIELNQSSLPGQYQFMLNHIPLRPRALGRIMWWLGYCLPPFHSRVQSITFGMQEKKFTIILFSVEEILTATILPFCFILTIRHWWTFRTLSLTWMSHLLTPAQLLIKEASHSPRPCLIPLLTHFNNGWAKMWHLPKVSPEKQPLSKTAPVARPQPSKQTRSFLLFEIEFWFKTQTPWRFHIGHRFSSAQTNKWEIQLIFTTTHWSRIRKDQIDVSFACLSFFSERRTWKKAAMVNDKIQCVQVCLTQTRFSAMHFQGFKIQRICRSPADNRDTHDYKTALMHSIVHSADNEAISSLWTAQTSRWWKSRKSRWKQTLRCSRRLASR